MYVYDDFLSSNCPLTSLKPPKCNKTEQKREFNDLTRQLSAKVCYSVFYLVQFGVDGQGQFGNVFDKHSRKNDPEFGCFDFILTMRINYAIYSIEKRREMSNFKVDFYKDADGSKHVGIFIRGLEIKLKAKVVASLKLLEEYGNLAREPLSKELEDGIFELRSIEGNDIVRILYFFDSGKRIIATNGFIKKKQKTPRSEIRLAKKCRADYHHRKETGTYE